MDNNFNNQNQYNQNNQMYGGPMYNNPGYNSPGFNYNMNNEPPKKVRDNGSFLAGILVGATIMIIGLMVILVANFLINKADSKNENDKDKVYTIDGEIGEDLEEIFDKASYIQSIIDEYYYYEEDMDKLADGVYSGMLYSLGDPYSVYYNKEAYDSMMESTSGTYCGIGVVVQQDIETMVITVVKPYEGCPGYEAGMQPGDIIVGVDDIDFAGMDINEAVSHIRGEENTSGTIHAIRDGEKIDFEVTRKEIDIPTVTYEKLDGDIAHITIESFDEVTYNQFSEAMDKAEADNCKGYIFDVRNNGGGLYNTVVDMLDDLLPEGKIVYTKDRNGLGDTEYSDPACLDAPMAVLINGNSASASEIFAGAIQDYGVGKLFGTTSFGKGIVQSVIPLGDGTAMKITVSSYFTPNGRNIHGTGIDPDVTVELPEDEEAYDRGTIKREYDTQLDAAVEYIKGEVK